LWSLAIEEQFYLVWPTMVLFASRRGVVRLCIVAIVGALALRAGLVMAHVRPGGVYFPTPCRVDALAFGALAATLSREMAAARLAQIARRILWPASLVLAGIVVWNGEWHLPSEWMMQTLGLTLLATISTCIVVMAIGAPAQSHLRRALEARWLRAFGRYSYAMYVFHVMLTSVFTPFRTYRPSATPLGELMWLFAATVPCAIVTFGLAFLSWHGFEKHLLKLKRFFPRPTERSTTSVEAQADPAA
jgi:peptidoglycan/LPS O-acetylase OafA/YrhL